MVNVGRVSGDYRFEPEARAIGGERYTHRRSVSWLKSVPRSSFSQRALNEIGSAITLFKVSSNAEEFVAILSGEQIAVEDIDEASAGLVTEQVELSTADFVIKRLKFAQSHYQFERFVAHLLKCMGYYSRVTQASNDGGIDVIAHRDELGFEPPIIKAQCKQTLGTIGRPDVQRLHGAIEPGEFGLFVTLGSFSAEARVYERAKPNLRLIDGETLVELIYAHYSKFDPRFQALVPLKQTYVPAQTAQDG